MSFNLMDLVKQNLSADAVGQIAQTVGIDQGTANNAIGAILPMLVSGLANNASTEQGAAGLMAALDRDHDGSVLNDVMGFFGSAEPRTKAEEGDKIVNHILGDKTEPAAQGIGQAFGIQPGQAMQLFSKLAPLVMGALGSQKKAGGLDLGALVSMLTAQKQTANAQAPSQLSGLLSMLDRNKDGNVIDDVVGMLGGLFGGKK